MLLLEGFQAGLSWLTILKRREQFRAAFHRFDPNKIARYTPLDRARLLRAPGVIHNHLKIDAAITNARAFLAVRREFGTFDSYIWQFTRGRTFRPATPPRSFKDLPTQTPESLAMSRDLRSRGFRFVGPTICYAFMQACGLANDHQLGCFKYHGHPTPKRTPSSKSQDPRPASD